MYVSYHSLCLVQTLLKWAYTQTYLPEGTILQWMQYQVSLIWSDLKVVRQGTVRALFQALFLSFAQQLIVNYGFPWQSSLLGQHALPHYNTVPLPILHTIQWSDHRILLVAPNWPVRHWFLLLNSVMDRWIYLAPLTVTSAPIGMTYLKEAQQIDCDLAMPVNARNHGTQALYALIWTLFTSGVCFICVAVWQSVHCSYGFTWQHETWCFIWHS